MVSEQGYFEAPAIMTLQWSHVFSDMVRFGAGIIGHRTRALQWSHVFSDMVREWADRGIIALSLLQWSHVFSDMVSFFKG
jgi:hypothetical protein